MCAYTNTLILQYFIIWLYPGRCVCLQNCLFSAFHGLFVKCCYPARCNHAVPLHLMLAPASEPHVSALHPTLSRHPVLTHAAVVRQPAANLCVGIVHRHARERILGGGERYTCLSLQIQHLAVVWKRSLKAVCSQPGAHLSQHFSRDRLGCSRRSRHCASAPGMPVPHVLSCCAACAPDDAHLCAASSEPGVGQRALLWRSRNYFMTVLSFAIQIL